MIKILWPNSIDLQYKTLNVICISLVSSVCAILLAVILGWSIDLYWCFFLSCFFWQALQNEVVSQASSYSNLLQLKETLFSVATKDDIKMMKLHLEQLDERWRDLPQIISKRLTLNLFSFIMIIKKKFQKKKKRKQKSR